jgi:hypothetical protein
MSVNKEKRIMKKNWVTRISKPADGGKITSEK